MDDFLDKEIKLLIDEEVIIPEGVMNKVNTSFDIIREKERIAKYRKNRIRKRCSAVAAILLLVVGISVYKPVFAAVKGFLFGVGDKGLQRAADNNYMQKLSNIYSESSSVRIEATEVAMDSSKLAINLKLNFKDIDVIKSKNDMSLDFALKDEKGTIITGEGGGVTGFMEMQDLSKKDSGEAKLSIVLDSPEAKIPKSKSLRLEIGIIYLDMTTKAYKRIPGEWVLNIPVDSEINNNNSIRFVPNNNNSKLEVISAEAFPTGLVVKFKAKNNGHEDLVERAKLIGENNKVYKIAGSASMENLPNGEDLVTMNFDATSFDKLDQLKLKLDNLDGKDEIVTLSKVK